MTIFNASLLAKPWFQDIPTDLEHEPLKGLTDLRPGSVHKPVFAVRRRICFAALNALFSLVTRQSGRERLADNDDNNNDDIEEPESSFSLRLAMSAAPYLLLRVVHPLKTLISDQRLRGLTPPPLPQQAELQMVLTKFVELRSVSRAFAEVTASTGVSKRKNSTDDNVDDENEEENDDDDDEDDDEDDNGNGNGYNHGDDGKEHLRILYPFLLRVATFWRGLPRLKGEGAWQADEAGKAIDAAITRWSEVVGEAWGSGV